MATFEIVVKMMARGLGAWMACNVMMVALVYAAKMRRYHMLRQAWHGVAIMGVAFVVMVYLLVGCATVNTAVDSCTSLISSNPQILSAMTIAAAATHTGMAYYAPAEYTEARVSAQAMINVLRGQTVAMNDLRSVPGWAQLLVDFLSQLIPANGNIDDCTKQHMIKILEMI